LKQETATMSKAIDTLMTEHRLIEKVLGSLRTFVDQLTPGQEEARVRVAEYAEFFREFADRCHHGKEEDRLFPVMEGHGFPANAGPLYVMRHEHELGRAHVRSLAGVGEGDGGVNESEVATVRTHAAEFIALLSAHIMKEDRILFPAAKQAIPEPELETLATGFDEFDADGIGAATLERLHALATALITSFPTDMTVLDAAGGCGPCGH
jgi:hemerythrin-like domain-containing protein